MCCVAGIAGTSTKQERPDIVCRVRKRPRASRAASRPPCKVAQGWASESRLSYRDPLKQQGMHMQPSTAIHASISILLLTACAISAAQGKLEYRGPGTVDLPPIGERRIIGTWLTKPPPDSCTRSFEEVRKKVYMVVRCVDGSGGRTGQMLTAASAKKFVSRTSPTGDYYLIQANGDLSVRDKDGEVELEPKHPSLWPTSQPKSTAQSGAEDVKTKGLTCYDVGYRYGHSGTSSMKGKPVNPSWDFATPARCKGDPETHRGVQAGTRAAW